MTVADPAESTTEAPSSRGRLTVYLGAAPGVGKTFAMLDEAERRKLRGTDVVIGLVETHGRVATADKIGDLEVIPRRVLEHRGVTLTDLDVDAVIARAPDVALVDELAHTNPPGSARDKRWQDVTALLDAGIDVVTTVNVQHLASLVDDVEAITGVRQRETVPDHVVREADQIQLVDLSPQQLRRRLAHGNIYRAEQVDASLGKYFREGNLTALRELALLWLADRVDDALTRYRSDHEIDATWPARERVVVAVTGGAESEALIRRASRIAQRSAGSELIAVHVLPTDGLPAAPPAAIANQRLLIESLGGTFHTVAGEDVALAVVDFARGVNATMIVVGVSRHSRWRQALSGSSADAIARLSGAIDVHLVTHEHAGAGTRPPSRTSSMSRGRRAAGWLAAIAAPLVVAWVADAGAGGADDLSAALMLQLAVVVGVALIGGLWPALVAAVLSFLALNLLHTEPTGRLVIDQPSDVLALVVFVVVAAAVASVVDLASRRTAQAYRARAEASTLAALSRSVLSGDDTADAIVSRLREVFGLDQVRLEQREGARAPWGVLAAAGADAPCADPATVDIDERHRMVLCGRPLAGSDREVAEAFGSQMRIVLEHRRLRQEADAARRLEASERTRNALLAAVSHDLRTPLAAIRAAVDGLASGIRLDEDDRAALTKTIQEGTGRLERLIDNLLDLSRLQAGAVHARLRASSLEEVVPAAVEPWHASVKMSLPEDLPLVETDPGLLERVVENLVSNAVRHTPPGTAVRVSAAADGAEVVIRVADSGPGVPESRKNVMFEAFQRFDGGADGGVGLGLAVADGLAATVGARVVPEDTPGGGLTMVVTVPRVREDRDMGHA
ncbi:ATP-binding protein [Demequina sp. NBRC 110055]|uniref:ATP-binding protein n=1 Tax=Demequina sp. NBRC 110055 TaxID=1570344 RepID=UPI0009FCD97C|nr:ATP-binding protein [Demequina sp. NBRC 110055]